MGEEVAVVADAVQDAEGALRGHGVQLRDGMLVATVCGVVQRVNKLVTVQAWQQRYRAEVGDVVVGRVIEASGKRWRVDLGAQVDAALLLSAVNLPGGAQRRRTAEDELNMRSIFKEGDLLTAEVQAVHHDGSIMLHTRSSKYGQLQEGLVVAAAPGLIKRQKQHFIQLGVGTGVSVVLGCNGLVWIEPGPQTQSPSSTSTPGDAAPTTKQQAEAVSRAAQAVRLLSQLHCAITPAAILMAVRLSKDTPAQEMLSPTFRSKLLEAAVLAH